MARAIDGDKLLEQLQKKKAGPANKRYTEGFNDCLMRVRSMVHSMPTLTPPNEPLTLEQLREMKDEPAYLKVFDPLLESGWHIIKAVTEDKIIFMGWQTVYVPIDGMSIDYNLYRRPPEGEV